MDDKDKEPPPTSTSPKKTDYVPGTRFSARWRNTFALLTGRLSPEGEAQWKLDRDLMFEEEDCRRCEKHRDYLLTYSPIIIFLNTAMSQLHGSINASNVRCRRCTVRRFGEFSPQSGVTLCANEMRDRSHVEETMAHEMMHAYDHLRFKVDVNNIKHIACGEIRACSLSGECRFFREFFTRGQRRVTQQHQECVRRRAILSVASHHSAGDPVADAHEPNPAAVRAARTARAEKAVNEVWESCFADTRPFDEIYR